ncbi:MAG: S41 family peptidase [Gammaproteobacteria bacterium]|nr:S41 family peptidase [Gammaproteobacteria bacterium]
MNRSNFRVFRRTFFLVLTAALATQRGVLAADDDPTSIPLEQIRVFTEVLHLIKRDYVEPVDDKTLLENAIRGMLSGLDPHSAYLSDTEYTGLQEGTTGEFGGLGLEVGLEDGFIRVIAPIDDTPAQRAGVQAGDLIVRLDDTPVKGMSLDDAIDLMRGAPGAPILLTIMREGQDAPMTIEVIRDIIKVKSIRTRMLEPGIAYVRISQFQASTGNDLRAAVVELNEQAGGALKGLVLDLRNNPGGVLGAAVGVADVFLEDGLIVYTKGRIEDSEYEARARPPDLLAGAPVIVLVNEGSASASEIVAGALQDRGRALIVGRKSFGKGSVQTILPMPGDAALKLTTALYYTPSGRSIQAEGIKPDITIGKLRVEAPESGANTVITEADLSRHLQNATSGADSNGTSDDESSAEDTVTDAASLASQDYELYEALNVLKGMILMQARASNPTH